jgi:hypothetical protein
MFKTTIKVFEKFANGVGHELNEQLQKFNRQSDNMAKRFGGLESVVASVYRALSHVEADLTARMTHTMAVSSCLCLFRSPSHFTHFLTLGRLQRNQ